MTTAELRIDAVDPADEAGLRQWFDLLRLAQDHDLPDDPPLTWIDVGARLQPRGGKTVELWLARHGEEAVGAVVIFLPTLDNLDNATVDVVVAPQHRRRRVGTRLLEHVGAAARDRGRSLLFLEAQQPLDGPSPATLFLEAAGARLALADTRRALDLTALDQPELDRLLADARDRAVGYRLVQWVGATPQPRLDDMARLAGRMSTDAPLDDLQLEPEVWDAERLLGRERALAARGLYSIVTAVADEHDALVGYTVVLGFTGVGWFGQQSDTIVLTENRGHRLGMLLKLANLAFARARNPELRVIHTYNADSNAHMVGINEAMGFRPLDRLGEWELDLV
ncbi:GNAT family N-acetyltransferase [Pseudonocardia sp. GCM10023141]|uniref:GNAT family N-acetyltransferase n=1 Tax=Pseudonocardia sp. GCM10023141 TaxID=3252653 RepID=UPI0036187589